MRIHLAVSLGLALAWTASPARGQAPAPADPPTSPGATGTVPAGAPVWGAGAIPAPAPSAAPVPSPPASPAVVSPPPASPAVVSPPLASPAVVSPEPPKEPPPMRGRVGFGIGLWGIPWGLLSSGGGSKYLGGQLGVRWWASERVVVLPSLALSVSHESVPEKTNEFGEVVPGRESTNGMMAPAVQFAYTLYKGQTTRFLMSGGPSFLYSVQANTTQYWPDGSPKPPAELRELTFALLAGMAIEQFFTSRISIVLGVDAPIFAYTSTQLGEEDATETVSAAFDSTRLVASVFFYLD